MARRNIYQVGDPVLRQVSKPVTEFDDKLSQLIDDMIDTLIYADGAGLAAPQIGVPKRIFVATFDGGSTIIEAVNPVIVSAKGKRVAPEGCLSVPNTHEKVERPRHVVVHAFDRHGNPIVLKADNFPASCYCHEIDHLDGIIFTDKSIKPKKK
ncbi:MAG: peptide deformylase [Clostridiales bacterium]|nr:peptide deformylase [Clostridiales bacterium]